MGILTRRLLRIGGNAVAEIRKTLKQRVEDLNQSLTVIKANLEMALTHERFALFLPVCGQLRNLLVTSKTNHPLLLELANETEFSPEFFSIPLNFLEQQATILGPDSIQWTGDSIRSSEEGPPFHKKVTMSEWLASTQVTVYGKRITGEQLISMAANKLGGSHFDPTLPTELAEMQLFEIGGLPSQYLTLVRLGEVVLYLGESLLLHARQRV